MTSFAVVYAVVAALKVAELVYRAILNVCVVSPLKSISAPKRATLKDVHIAWVIAILASLTYWDSELARTVRIFT